MASLVHLGGLLWPLGSLEDSSEDGLDIGGSHFSECFSRLSAILLSLRNDQVTSETHEANDTKSREYLFDSLIGRHVDSVMSVNRVYKLKDGMTIYNYLASLGFGKFISHMSDSLVSINSTPCSTPGGPEFCYSPSLIGLEIIRIVCSLHESLRVSQPPTLKVKSKSDQVVQPGDKIMDIDPPVVPINTNGFSRPVSSPASHSNSLPFAVVDIMDFVANHSGLLTTIDAVYLISCLTHPSFIQSLRNESLGIDSKLTAVDSVAPAASQDALSRKLAPARARIIKAMVKLSSAVRNDCLFSQSAFWCLQANLLVVTTMPADFEGISNRPKSAGAPPPPIAPGEDLLVPTPLTKTDEIKHLLPRQDDSRCSQDTDSPDYLNSSSPLDVLDSDIICLLVSVLKFVQDPREYLGRSLTQQVVRSVVSLHSPEKSFVPLSQPRDVQSSQNTIKELSLKEKKLFKPSISFSQGTIHPPSPVSKETGEAEEGEAIDDGPSGDGLVVPPAVVQKDFRVLRMEEADVLNKIFQKILKFIKLMQDPSAISLSKSVSNESDAKQTDQSQKSVVSPAGQKHQLFSLSVLAGLSDFFNSRDMALSCLASPICRHSILASILNSLKMVFLGTSGTSLLSIWNEKVDCSIISIFSNLMTEFDSALVSIANEMPQTVPAPLITSQSSIYTSDLKLLNEKKRPFNSLSSHHNKRSEIEELIIPNSAVFDLKNLKSQKRRKFGTTSESRHSIIRKNRLRFTNFLNMAVSDLDDRRENGKDFLAEPSDAFPFLELKETRNRFCLTDPLPEDYEKMIYGVKMEQRWIDYQHKIDLDLDPANDVEEMERALNDPLTRWRSLRSFNFTKGPVKYLRLDRASMIKGQLSNWITSAEKRNAEERNLGGSFMDQNNKGAEIVSVMDTAETPNSDSKIIEVGDVEDNIILLSSQSSQNT